MMTFLFAWFLLYWLPTILAMARGSHSTLGIAVLNFFGFTGIGWILALIWALAASPSERVIVIENGRVVR